MLKVLVGHPIENYNSWLRGNVVKVFTRKIQENWFEHPLVLEELRKVEDIVKVDGYNFYKSNGRRIIPEWIAHSSKQFILMTQFPNMVCDSCYIGGNVYQFFYRWSLQSKNDVTILIENDDCAFVEEEFKGILLNTGEHFTSGRDLFFKKQKCYKCVLETIDKHTLKAKPYTGTVRDEGGIQYIGGDYIINIL